MVDPNGAATNAAAGVTQGLQMLAMMLLGSLTVYLLIVILRDGKRGPTVRRSCTMIEGPSMMTLEKVIEARNTVIAQIGAEITSLKELQR